MADIKYPCITGERGIGYWLRPKNLFASRQKFLRADYSNEWRYEFGDPLPFDRSIPLFRLLFPPKDPHDGFRFVILGDTGEGDESQYGLLPLIRSMNPDFLIINGDVAYPAGRIGRDEKEDDFLAGFFQPYSNFNCPIWATPGNHEYYSPNNGRDFYDIFCTRKFDDLWSNYSLRHDILQPGMYWELNDLNGSSKLVIIGLDSGKSANLDGHNNWLEFWKRKIYPDHVQHNWLDERLQIAQRENGKVIILFHIPALAREIQVEKHLSTLHKIIADYSCIKLIICGHDHNHQQYTSAAFRNYLESEVIHNQIKSMVPDYMVNGGGGAYLQSTAYADGNYTSIRFPTRDQWNKFAYFGRRMVGKLGRDKSWLSRAVGFWDKDSLSDADVPNYLSFICVEYRPNLLGGASSLNATPVFLEDLQLLFNHLPYEQIVNVSDPQAPVNPFSVQQCIQNHLSIKL